eukprot:scaffold669558_cov79-Attheya_sp.AAC.1
MDLNIPLAYMSLRGDAQSVKARKVVEGGHQESGPTFDPNIRLGPKLDQNGHLHASQRRRSKC